MGVRWVRKKTLNPKPQTAAGPLRLFRSQRLRQEEGKRRPGSQVPGSFGGLAVGFRVEGFGLGFGFGA